MVDLGYSPAMPGTRCSIFLQTVGGGINKKKSGRLLNGRTYDEMPVLVLTANLL
jgi:protein gp37